MKRIIQKFFIFTIIILSILLSSILSSYADTNNSESSNIIVSMGDSYSSGEGIDDFFGCKLPLKDKVLNLDWLAHRSENAWSGMLSLNGVVMKDHHYEYTDSNSVIESNWFFVAASGATTWNINNSQKKEYKKLGIKDGSKDLPPQIDVFNILDNNGKKADYVTLTMGGNDAGFADIIIDVALGSTYLNFSNLSDHINYIWGKFYSKGGIKDNLSDMYTDISNKAGKQANIIVAGYPKLLEPSGKGFLVSHIEATIVNNAVSNFNNAIEHIVNQHKSKGESVYFVPVEDAFENHAAFSTDSWINGIIPIPSEQDISDIPVSAYSMHPNYKGAKDGYRKCVQNKIDELEELKKSKNIDDNNERYTTENKNYSQNTNGFQSTERDVVLVLDASGSMSGTPLNETKKAATKFVDTVLEQSANIGIVKYDDQAEVVSQFSTDGNVLKSAINNLGTGGATDIEDGLSKAESMLSSSSGNKKIIVLMSDGEPNDGKVGEELIAYADELKKKDIYIYTLGFFESLGDKASAQYLMEKIASDGCHYEVSDADSLVYFFGDIADQINGQKFIYVRIACPVDVSVSYNGEKLDSSANTLNTRTSFGSLTFEEADTQSYDSYNSYYSSAQSDENTDRVKILRLKEGEDYDIKIEGTGKGRMNYSVGFMNENGEYSDFRKFNNVKITRKTQIDTVAAVSDKTVLNVDEDGDGKYDLTYEARANERGKIVDNSFIVKLIIILVGVLMLLILILIIYKKVQKSKANKTRRDYNG